MWNATALSHIDAGRTFPWNVGEQLSRGERKPENMLRKLTVIHL
jgi:hypothetical protein